MASRRYSRFKTTLLAALAGLFIWIVAFFTQTDLFDVLIHILDKFEEYEIDEILIALFLITIGLTVDLISIRRRREKEIEIFKHRIQVLRVTVRTVQDLIGNFLNQLQLFRLTASGCSNFSEESLRELDELISNTANRLKVLGELEEIPEKELSHGVTIIDLSKVTPQDDSKKEH